MIQRSKDLTNRVLSGFCFGFIRALDGANDLAGTNTAAASLDCLSGAFDDSFHALDIGHPTRTRLDVGVGYEVAGDRSFSTEITKLCHDV